MKAVVRLLVVAVLVAVTTSVGAPSQASASFYAGACTTASGRTVVVDFTALGRGISQSCYTGPDSTAAYVVPDVGHSLQRDHQGAVCRIDGDPSVCPPQLSPNGYWHLYWSDGGSGVWTSASTGDGGLDIPCGGSVAWSWDTEASGYNATPKAAAPHFGTSGTCGAKPVTSPSPRPSASSHPSSGSHPSSTTSPSASASVTTSASGSASASPSSSASPSTTASASPTTMVSSGPGPAVDSTLQTTPSSSHGLAWWVAPVIIVLLGAVAGTIWFVRRRP